MKKNLLFGVLLIFLVFVSFWMGFRSLNSISLSNANKQWSGKAEKYLPDVNPLLAAAFDLQKHPVDGNSIEGEWTYECDVLHFNRYTWSSDLFFGYGQYQVNISFDDLDIRLGGSNLAFIIRSIQPEYKYNWLYTMKDGTYNPKISYFDEIGPMKSYPGGYNAFESELKAMGIDWEYMYRLKRFEFLSMYSKYGNIFPCVNNERLHDAIDL